MKPSPLQLIRYVVPEVSCSANAAFAPEKESEGAIGHLSANAVVARQKDPETAAYHAWSVEMTISQKVQDGQSVPYRFSLSLVGFFACKVGFPSAEQEEIFVRVNGSSILYGAAREIVRSLTAPGPWGEVILPTLSFYDKPAAPSTETPAAHTSV